LALKSAPHPTPLPFPHPARPSKLDARQRKFSLPTRGGGQRGAAACG
jgi:hypothetical protein